MSDKRATADLVVAEIADHQHGVVSVSQMRAAGLDGHGIFHRARTGRLHQIHRGVYAVGHSALSSEARWMGAVLACGRRKVTAGTVLDFWGAALSHLSAAHLWRLLAQERELVDVSVPGEGGRRRRVGVRLHRSRSLLPADVTLRGGIPVTTPARTIADLRRASAGNRRLIAPRELRRAIRQADVLGLAIGEEESRDRTRSDLERDFLRLCRRHRLPVPEVNVRIGQHLVDFLWREWKLVVETDGYRYHGGRAAFEDDRARDLDLRLRGYAVIRVSGRQVDEEPGGVAAVLAAALRPGREAAPRTDL